MYSEKAKKFCEIFTLLLPYEVPVKSKAKISQNFVAFSEYMNFTSVSTLTDRISLSLGHEGEEYSYFVFLDEQQMALYIMIS